MFEKPVVAQSGLRLKVLEINPLEIVTEPFFSSTADLKEEPSISQSLFFVSFPVQNVVARSIIRRGNILFITLIVWGINIEF
jgi:hypothetical protein